MSERPIGSPPEAAGESIAGDADVTHGMSPANSRLLDTIESLRLAGALVAQLGDQTAEADTPAGSGTPVPLVASLPGILIRTSCEITAVLNSLYRSRAFLEQAAVPRLQRTNHQLEEVSSATESATHNLLDGIDRSMLLIDEIERRFAHGVEPGDPAAEQLHAELREQTHRLLMSLQFQDIVAQQIAFATHVLQDTERRMIMIAEHFDATVFGRTEEEPLVEPEWNGPFDPTATLIPADERQAVADAIMAEVSRDAG